MSSFTITPKDDRRVLEWPRKWRGARRSNHLGRVRTFCETMERLIDMANVPMVARMEESMGIAKPRQHVWDWHMSMAEQATCWCRPFVSEQGYVFHRPWPSSVFHEFGEQGPVGAECIMFTDPVLEPLT